MLPNQKFGKLADLSAINRVVESFQSKGVEIKLAKNAQEAKKMILTKLPLQAEIMNMTSITLQTLGIDQEINESGKFNSIRKNFESLDPKNQKMEMKRLGSAHSWSIGSVHAITEDGFILIASNTGSQLPAYAYGADHVLWVIGAQKIVKNLEEGLKRIYEYSLPLEDVRAQNAYGVHSAVNKILIIGKEVVPKRLNIILVKEKLGF